MIIWDVSVFDLPIGYSSLNPDSCQYAEKEADDGPSTAIHVKDLDGNPGSWFGPGPQSSAMSIWGVNWQMEKLLLLVFQIKNILEVIGILWLKIPFSL